VAGQVGARAIAVGHNADDQTETVLMHWLRGSGLAGLRGMLPATPMGDLRLPAPRPAGASQGGLAGRPGEIGDCLPPGPLARARAGWRVGQGRSGIPSPISGLQSLTLIRPLLDIPRADIEAYCARYNLQPRFDRSNLDTTYFRNRLRHELIPYLETYNVNIREVLRRSASVMAADYELLRQRLEVTWGQVVRAESDQEVTFDLAAWRALPLALKRSTLREAIHRLRRALRNIDFVHVENAVEILTDGETGAQATLPQGLMLTIGYDSFTVADQGYRMLPDLPLLLSTGHLPVAIPGRTQLPGTDWLLWVEILPRSALSDQALVAAQGWEVYLDSAGVGSACVLRPRRPGDRFCPLGMGGRSKRVNEFMINEKIPASWREHIPLLVNEEGRIVWVCGWRPDERACVTGSTQQVVWLRFERE
jgi:tRNA(Ile)-lysidine synthase